MANVRQHFARVLDAVQKTHERVVITRNGAPTAVLLAIEDYEGLLETLDILRNPDEVKDLREAADDPLSFTLEEVLDGMDAQRRAEITGQ